MDSSTFNTAYSGIHSKYNTAKQPVWLTIFNNVTYTASCLCIPKKTDYNDLHAMDSMLISESIGWVLRNYILPEDLPLNCTYQYLKENECDVFLHVTQVVNLLPLH